MPSSIVSSSIFTQARSHQPRRVAAWFTILGCFLILSTGCGKVPTWNELTAKEKAAETTAGSATGSEQAAPVVTPAQPKQPATPPQKTPQQVIEAFMQTKSYDRSDEQLAELLALPPEHLNGITELDLSAARRVSASGIASLAALPSLRVLKLNNSKVSTEVFAGISGLTQLEVFAAQKSSFDERSMGYLAPLTNLKVLDLSETAIGDQGFINLKKMNQLEEIYVQGCASLTGRGFEALKGAPLRIVVAAKTQFGQFGMFHLKGCRTLKVLGASNCGVTDQSLLHIKSCANLEQLNLGHNSLSDIGAKQLGAHRGLLRLNLRNTGGISDRGLVFLKNMKKLEALDLEGTAASPRGVEALRKLLKFCSIQYQTRIWKGDKVTS